jgi:hypothetical protein
VVRDGRPVRDVVIGACGTDRTIGNFTGDFTIASQADGRFLLPREQAYLPQNQPIRGVPNPEQSECKTDAEGRFQFAPKFGDGELFAATEASFARACRPRRFGPREKCESRLGQE